MTTKIDFTAVFTSANNEAEVNNLMTSLVESVLKAGHARIESFTVKGKKIKKNTEKLKGILSRVEKAAALFKGI